MLKKAPQQASDAYVLAQALYTGLQTADPPHDEVYPDTGPGGRVQGVDAFGVDQAAYLDNDPGIFA